MHRTLTAWAGLGLLTLASGCCMCDAPYDYCGPTFLAAPGEECVCDARVNSAFTPYLPVDGYGLIEGALPPGAVPGPVPPGAVPGGVPEAPTPPVDPAAPMLEADPALPDMGPSAPGSPSTPAQGEAPPSMTRRDRAVSFRR